MCQIACKKRKVSFACLIARAQFHKPKYTFLTDYLLHYPLLAILLTKAICLIGKGTIRAEPNARDNRRSAEGGVRTLRHRGTRQED